MVEYTEPGIVLAIGIFAAVTLAFSIVMHTLLFGLLVVFALLAVYLAWRFVRALERIARALEANANVDADRELPDR
jgi:membrane protein implicated in regulation of membrane protease activity